MEEKEIDSLEQVYKRKESKILKIIDNAAPFIMVAGAGACLAGMILNSRDLGLFGAGIMMGDGSYLLGRKKTIKEYSHLNDNDEYKIINGLKYSLKATRILKRK